MTCQLTPLTTDWTSQW